MLLLFQNVNNSGENMNCIESEYSLPVPMAPAATPVQVSNNASDPNDTSLFHQDAACGSDSSTDVKIKFETLRSLSQQTTLDMDTHMSQQAHNLNSSDRSMMINSNNMMNLMPEDQDGFKEGSYYLYQILRIKAKLFSFKINSNCEGYVMYETKKKLWYINFCGDTNILMSWILISYEIYLETNNICDKILIF